MKNRLSKSECSRSRQEAIRNREAPCTWTTTATPPSTASSSRPSCGKTSRRHAAPPARASPPSEGWPSDLGCARNTVEQAYHLLVQEGYVESRPGSGYVVQNVTYLQPRTPHALLRRAAGVAGATGPLRLHLRQPGTGHLPAAAWRTITDDVLLSVEAPAVTPTTTRSARRPCAWPLRGASPPSATSTAPQTKSSSRAAPRRAFRTY